MRLGLARRCIAVLSAVLTFGLIGASPAAESGRTHPVGIKQVEFADAHYGPRTLSMAVFYPAAIDESSAKPFVMPFFAKLALYKDAEIAFDGEKRPLVMLSHGRGSTGLSYAWFAQALASHGYIVAAPYHWRANNYDATVAYLANKLWQRPVDVSLDIDFLLSDPACSKYIDPSRIGVAGQPRRLHCALARRRRGQPRQIPRVPAGLEEQPADPRAFARRAAARS
jgi:predicted dienelactone hydrolase